MQGKRFTEQQSLDILRQIETGGTTAVEALVVEGAIAQVAGISRIDVNPATDIDYLKNNANYFKPKLLIKAFQNLVYSKISLCHD